MSSRSVGAASAFGDAEESNLPSCEWETTCVKPKPSKFFRIGSDTNTAFARLSLTWYS